MKTHNMRLTREQAKRKYAANKRRYAAKGYISRKSRVPSYFGDRTYTQCAWVKSQAMTGNASGGADKFYTFTFVLQDILDYQSWTSVFDQYRFKRVTALIQGVNQPTVGASVTLQPLVTVIDYDDGTPLTSYNAGLNYGSSMLHNPICNDTRTFVPHTSTAIVRSGVATNSGNVKNQWIDCAVTDVEHYGFKVAIPASTTTNIFGWTIVFKVCVEYKNNR